MKGIVDNLESMVGDGGVLWDRISKVRSSEAGEKGSFGGGKCLWAVQVDNI